MALGTAQQGGLASSAVPKPDIVDSEEMARRLGVKKETVRMWRWRGLLPEPDWVFGDQPVWQWRRIEAWARKTGRLKEEQ